ncbi:response regulator transcription factor [Inquilinus limosus]|uniref:response regulator transcription factor n=1 Tax=Inquilinus limosus TaxID=171674 RepID=UPI003F1877E1
MHAFRSGPSRLDESPVPAASSPRIAETGEFRKDRSSRRQPAVMSADQPIGLIAIIERRTLARETLSAAFSLADRRYHSRSFADLREWLADPDCISTTVLLLNIDALDGGEFEAASEIQSIARDNPEVRVVAFGEREDARFVAEILEGGARGYIPTSVGLSVAVQAVSLVMAGGAFVPVSTVRRSAVADREPAVVDAWSGLTERQFAVAEAMARGTPSKIIAYQLGLSESTVKIHIRGIMRKLAARNRTEAAFKLHQARSRTCNSSG